MNKLLWSLVDGLGHLLCRCGIHDWGETQHGNVFPDSRCCQRCYEFEWLWETLSQNDGERMVKNAPIDS